MDFLVFTKDAHENGIEVSVQEQDVWLTQKAIGQLFDVDYFDHLISEIQEIRASERRFYQKFTDIYATAVDYSLDSQITFVASAEEKSN